MTHHELVTQLESLGDNKINLMRLQEQVTTRLGVIPFVGAGLSIPFGFKGWGAFLIDQAQATKNAALIARIQALLDAGEYEQAGEEVFVARGHRNFLNALETEFGDAKLQGKSLDGAVSVLPRLAPGPVITTNFDHVLERVFEQAGKPFERAVWGAKRTSLHAALTQDKHFLLKLHGDVGEQDDRVLTRADYAKYYDAPDSPLSQILRRLFSARPILFLGCSLAQDRWVNLLREVTQADTSLEHFAILEYPATDAAYFTRQQFLSNHGITPIWFPPQRFDLIQAILELFAPPAAPPPLAKRNRLLTGADDSLLAHATGFFGRTREVETVLQFLRGTED
ncbi:MAG: SIR2 family protein, partial [Anaerolineales bacterium]|nr:SIR2 family protein [Anaerolineales bacterium]